MSWEGPERQIPLPKWSKTLQIFPKAVFFCPRARSRGQNPHYSSPRVWLSPGATRYTADLGEMLHVVGPGREFWSETESPGIRRFRLPWDVILVSQPGSDSACDTRLRAPGFSDPIPASSGIGQGGEVLKVAASGIITCMDVCTVSAWAQGPEVAVMAVIPHGRTSLLSLSPKIPFFFKKVKFLGLSSIDASLFAGGGDRTQFARSFT